MDNVTEQFFMWLEKATGDEDLINELNTIKKDSVKIEDAFYQDLEFGTGGLRGIIGAGTNRMNIYTVAKASQGLANYLKANFSKEKQKVVIGYDTRIKSELFAKTAAGVFAANGLQSFLYKKPMPTPCVSFAVRELKCAAGIMITASHNPAQYNGYKVYNADGCQITTKAAKNIMTEINHINIFSDVKEMPFCKGLENELISYMSERVFDKYITAVQNLFISKENFDKSFRIVYSPLNGTGLVPVTRALRESGFSNVTVVKEQEKPDGEFPTCPYPNPEIKEAMSLGIKYANQYHAELLIATDPDCDRVGIAVKNHQGVMELLTGNEVGLLLLDYICARRLAEGTMPENPVFVKSIVTTDMAEQIASRYGIKTVNVLTGFKYIGEQIDLLKSKEETTSYIFGFEESYGYLSGTHVRDKDAVNGTLLICELFAYYKAQNKSLIDKLNELYAEYGYRLNTLHCYEFEGASGMEQMKSIMQMFRSDIKEIGGKTIEKRLDYKNGIDGLPKSDVLKFFLSDKSTVVIRPSGTEPKLKIYISVSVLTEKKPQRLKTSF